MKKIIKGFSVAICSISLLLMFTSVSFTETGYCTNVQVVQAGAKVIAGAAQNVLLLKNTRADCDNWGQNVTWWFVMDSANADAMLASGLTAFSLGNAVTVVPKVASTYSNWGTLVQVSVQ